MFDPLGNESGKVDYVNDGFGVVFFLEDSIRPEQRPIIGDPLCSLRGRLQHLPPISISTLRIGSGFAFETWPHGVVSRTARADLRLASEAIRQCAMERLEREEPKAVNCQDGRPGAASPEADQQIADFAGDLEHELAHDAVLQIDPRATRAVILGRRLGKRTLAMSSSHEVLRLVDRIKRILVGQPPALQGAALAECLALWLAGHPLAAREDLLTMHIATVRLLTPLNAAALRGE